MKVVEKLERMLRGLISRAIVNSRAGNGLYQVLWLDDRVSADVELQQPQGVHFRAPSDALGVLLSPSGNQSASVLLCASGETPTDTVQAGEGGLHYLGAFKVFLKADGTLALGAYAPADFAAVASYVDARISAIVSAFNTHAHTGVTTGPGTSGTPAAPLSGQASVASTKVRIEP